MGKQETLEREEEREVIWTGRKRRKRRQNEGVRKTKTEIKEVVKYNSK